jgi:hypothetical protein
MRRVQQTIEETRAVATLLAGILTDDEALTPEPPPATEAAVGGLDGPHSTLARVLAKQDSWGRNELEALAAQHGLLPDGAIDVINEAALDRTGEVLFDGDDPVTIVRPVAEELLS